jgi:hypothetical protein
MNSLCSSRLSQSIALLLLVTQLNAAEPAPKAPAPAASPARAGEPAPATNELHERAARLVIPSLQFRDATLAESVQFLRAKARALDPAHPDLNIEIAPAADGNDAKITLSLKQVSLAEALHYLAALAGLNVRFGATAISVEPGPAAEWKRLKMPASPESAKLKEKALAMIIPKLEFREAALMQALDFIQAKSRSLDPDQRGVNIVNLDLAAADARLTLSLTNVPVYEALRHVAELAGGKLFVEPEALVLRQAGGE